MKCCSHFKLSRTVRFFPQEILKNFIAPDEILPSEQASLSNPVLVTIMISDSQSQRGGIQSASFF